MGVAWSAGPGQKTSSSNRRLQDRIDARNILLGKPETDLTRVRKRLAPHFDSSNGGGGGPGESKDGGAGIA